MHAKTLVSALILFSGLIFDKSAYALQTSIEPARAKSCAVAFELTYESKNDLHPVDHRAEIEKRMLALRASFAPKSEVTPAERLAASKEIAELLVVELAKQNIFAEAFLNPGPPEDELTHSWMVAIQGVDTVDANVTSLVGVQRVFGANYLFWPMKQARDAGFLAKTMEKIGAIVLPIESILNRTVGQSLEHLHEIRHLALTTGLINGKQTPYYGEVISIGEKNVTSIPNYYRYWSFQELSTWQRDLNRTERGAERLAPVGFKVADLNSIEKTLKTMSETALQILGHARAQLENDSVEFSLDPQTNRVVATLPMEAGGEKVGLARFWLVDARIDTQTDAQKAVDRDRNKTLLLRYFDTMEKAAKRHLQRAEANLPKL